MKKAFILLLVLMLAIPFSACTKQEDTTNILMEETVKVDKVIYDNCNVKVTVTELIYHTFSNVGLVFHTENKRNERIYVETGNTSVNGLGVSAQLFGDVSSHDEADTEMQVFENDEAIAQDIKDIGRIAFTFRISTDNSEKTLDFVDNVEIIIDEKVKTDFKASGKEIYNDKGVTVYADKPTAKDTDELKYIKKLFITNETQSNLIVSVTGVYVNGTECHPYCYTYVPKESSSYRNLYLFKGELEEYGIEEIEEIELSIQVWDNDEEKEYSKSNMIKFDDIR